MVLKKSKKKAQEFPTIAEKLKRKLTLESLCRIMRSSYEMKTFPENRARSRAFPLPFIGIFCNSVFSLENIACHRLEKIQSVCVHANRVFSTRHIVSTNARVYVVVVVPWRHNVNITFGRFCVEKVPI